MNIICLGIIAFIVLVLGYILPEIINSRIPIIAIIALSLLIICTGIFLIKTALRLTTLNKEDINNDE
jgi:membrane-bound acyltransferase YfiQ involved in biofilm formation